MSDDTAGTPDHWVRQRLLWGLDIEPIQKLVLLGIDRFQGSNSEAFPTQQTLATAVRISDRYLRTLLIDLRDQGLIQIRRAKPNRLSINWGKLESGTGVPVSNRIPSSGSKRNSGSGLPPRNRNSSSDRTSTCKHPKNTHGADAVSKKRNGWEHGGIRDDELQTSDAIQARFMEAVESNYCHQQDRLRFFTLAIHVAQSKARSPGALFTRLLKARTWPGTDQQEDQAHRLIRDIDRQQAEPVNGHAQALGAALRSDFLPRRDDD